MDPAMPSLKLEPSQSLAQKVASRLRQAIIEGEFPPGAVIAEEMLAQSFGISRTPVREALNQLQLQGLVVIRPQVGSFVFSPDAGDIAMLCEFRAILEPQAARLAYRNDRSGTLAELETVIGEMEKAVAAKDKVAYGRADTAFHEAFVNHCGNRYVEDSYRLVAGRVAALRTNYSAPIDVQTPRSFKEHRAFVELFEKGDFEEFDRLMRIHVTDTAKTYTAALRL
ncbi:GntR family transcriptional regulator [Sinorhizobium fredii USDA 205]|uniref:FCD domain-containing protein n=3 Tax=Rhizobium fredii TaxID=380 RepID=A0A844A6F4_RHIFR|nr:Transcriptional regulator, GntR family [Sinorhizobium fredii CCBAU 83666]KSV82643.1 GntR family transcriptional regulator [Sinorhizobium fredii USDA 205]MQW94705.1 FCD domain-containing protein [Sinorhizobium fredii]CCF00813.1 Fatty acid metabolism regulator protein [Sinorhizobium fredii HH103]MQX08699.1 FCD domain-containing protein [Sinorhizobium fredii]